METIAIDKGSFIKIKFKEKNFTKLIGTIKFKFKLPLPEGIYVTFKIFDNNSPFSVLYENSSLKIEDEYITIMVNTLFESKEIENIKIDFKDKIVINVDEIIVVFDGKQIDIIAEGIKGAYEKKDEPENNN